MTVKQLRDWLIKQDETGKVSMKRKDEAVWRGEFQISVTSDMDTMDFIDIQPKREN